MAKQPQPAQRTKVYTVEWTGYYEQEHFRVFSTREKAETWMEKYRSDGDLAYVSEITLDPETEHGD
jgi:hypothetical protein